MLAGTIYAGLDFNVISLSVLIVVVVVVAVVVPTRYIVADTPQPRTQYPLHRHAGRHVHHLETGMRWRGVLGGVR